MTEAEKWNAFLAAFHERFPSHVGKRRRQEMFALAKKIVAEDVSTKDAEALIDRSIHKGHVRASDKALIMFMVFIAVWAWTMIMEPMLDRKSLENPETKQRFLKRFLRSSNKVRSRSPRICGRFQARCLSKLNQQYR